MVTSCTRRGHDARRYFGRWLPEPLITATEPDAAEVAELSDPLSVSFLVLLETLTPVERAVFLLREVFDYPYDQIAQIVDKSEPNCRQILTSARKRIDQGKPRFEVDHERQRELANRFLDAFENGEVEELVSFLAADVVFYGDGGGQGQGLPRPIYGADRVGRFLRSARDRFHQLGARLEPASINGEPGTLNFDADGRLINVFRVRDLRRPHPGDPLDHQPRQAGTPRLPAV